MAGTAERMGLKLMVDLVINHCAVDSPLIASHPKWFVWDARGKVSNPFCDDNGDKVVVGHNAFLLDPEMDNLLPSEHARVEPSPEQVARIEK